MSQETPPLFFPVPPLLGRKCPQDPEFLKAEQFEPPGFVLSLQAFVQTPEHPFPDFLQLSDGASSSCVPCVELFLPVGKKDLVNWIISGCRKGVPSPTGSLFMKRAMSSGTGDQSVAHTRHLGMR